jgi:tetratricopeptide (TPR) repeat protein
VAMQLDRPADAVRYFRATLQRKADHLPARVRLVVAYERLGQREQALQALQELQRLAPDHPDVPALARRLGLPPR